MFINEIIWTFTPCKSKTMSQNYNNILHYGFDSIFNKLFIPYKHVLNQGTTGYYLKTKGYDYAKNIHDRGSTITCVWTDIKNMKTRGYSGEYPTQKPFKLLERVICLSTK